MLKSLIIYAHPNPASFCAALKNAAIDELEKLGAMTRVHDLYQAEFDPILSSKDFEALARGQVSADVAKIQADITWADWLIVIHPTWWMGTPAILKGYFDRVLSHGFAFRIDADRPRGLLTGKNVMIFQTTGGTEELLAGSGLSQAIQKLTAEGVIQYCGMELVSHQFFYAVPTVDAKTRCAMLERFRTALGQQVCQA